VIRPSIECWLVRHTPGGAVVLLLHAPEAPGKRPEIWQPVSGGIEPGEDARTACCREVAEETGLTVAPGDLVCVIDRITIDARPGLTLEKAVFVAHAPEGRIRVEPLEHDNHEWVVTDEVPPRLVWDSHRTTWAAVAAAIPGIGDPSSP
jgi:8-oxo-dGTP pyrophosphatase MutT (NUDIX family)